MTTQAATKEPSSFINYFNQPSHCNSELLLIASKLGQSS